MTLRPRGRWSYGDEVATGNPSTIGVSGETLTYTYDGSLPLSEAWSGTVAGSITRTYDTSFRVIEQRVNGGSAIGFVYDDDDLLTGAGAMTLTRDSATGLLTATALGNATDSHGYNPFGEVMTYAAAVNSAAVYSVGYTRDALGRIDAKTETLGGVTNSYGYTYDPAGRLTDVTTNSSLTAHYDYDANGNRVGGSNQVCGLIGDAAIDAQDRLLAFDCGVATVSYTYTDNGELESKTVSYPNSQPPDIVTTYQYDLFGNLRSVTLPTGGGIDYVIDGQNRRAGKKVNGVLSRGWLYDGQLRIVAELDGSNAVVSRFVYASKTNVPDYMLSGGVTYRLISDHLGSVRLALDATSGAVAQRLDYDEFGNVLADTNPGFQPFGFAGGLYDPDTGLVRFGARDYDPQTGRWTAKDPIGFEGDSFNLYTYVNSDPVNFTDPTGTEGLFQQMFGIGFRSALRSVFQSRPGSYLFGKSGLLNTNRYLRVGLGKGGGPHKGQLVFRIAGNFVRWITTEGHIILIDLGPL